MYTCTHVHTHIHRLLYIPTFKIPTSVCVFIIREVNSELDSEEDLTKLITFMIDSDNEKVNSTHGYIIYISLHHKGYWCRASVSNVNEYHNGCFRKVCYYIHFECLHHISFTSKEYQSILRLTLNGCFSQLESMMANGFLSASQR